MNHKQCKAEKPHTNNMNLWCKCDGNAKHHKHSRRVVKASACWANQIPPRGAWIPHMPVVADPVCEINVGTHIKHCYVAIANCSNISPKNIFVKHKRTHTKQFSLLLWLFWLFRLIIFILIVFICLSRGPLSDVQFGSLLLAACILQPHVARVWCLSMLYFWRTFRPCLLVWVQTLLVAVYVCDICMVHHIKHY